MAKLADMLCAAALLRLCSASYTLSDDKLSATFGATAPDGFGVLTELKAPGAASVLAASSGKPGAVWSASFVGPGAGTASLDSASTTCVGHTATSDGATPSRAVTFQWFDCEVALPPAPAPPSPGPAVWQQHNASTCAGACLPGHSSGPKGGNCDRLPGCGHDAGLPYCEIDAMKARCANASGCTEFNTNGYLYGGGAKTAPFHDYPLECWTLGGAGPVVASGVVNVTLEVVLAGGLLESTIAFASDGASPISLWGYTLSLPGLRAGATTRGATSSAARQMAGIYDDGDGEGGASSGAVYFSAHDPKQTVKQCGATVHPGSTASLHCTMDALDASLPLRSYRAGFPLVASVVVGGDWWDIAQIYRSWVLPNAAWTALGPLDGRSDMPDWLENITLWMNNNWGGDPLGPNYGGDPAHVQGEMLQVNEVLGLPSHGGHLALHWYEWDTLGYLLGSNHTKCDRAVGGCGFDTHYPN